MKNELALALLASLLLAASSQAQTDIWVVRESLPVRRGALTVEALDGRVHVVGGATNWGGSGTTGRHDVFDPMTGIWTTAATLPDTNGWGPASAVLAGELYVLGGWPSAGFHRRYDPTTDNWTSIASAGSYFYGHTAAAVNGVLYLIGTPWFYQSSQSYDPGTNSWSPTATFPDPSGQALTGRAIGTEIFVVGAGTSLWIYDTVTDTWSQGADLLSSVHAGAAAVLDGKLHVFGGSTTSGSGGNVTATAQLYDPLTDTWSLLPDMPTARSWVQAATVANSIFVIGGFDEGNNAISPDPNEEWVSGQAGTRLAFPAGLGFDGADGIAPNQGLPGQVFDFRVEYSDASGLPPAPGFPKLHLDLNDDGDTLDPGEGDFVMLAVDADTNVVDGKVYSYTTGLPDPGAGSYRHAFSAENTTGAAATGAPTAFASGPSVRDDFYELAIFANDILFSTPNPTVAEVFTVTVRVHNASLLPVDDLSVVVEGDDATIFSGSIEHLDPGSVGEVSFGWALPEDGFYPVRAFVDFGNDFVEWNELNNDATRPIVVGEYVLPGSIDVAGLPAATTFFAGGNVGFGGRATYLGTPLDPPPFVQGATVTFRPSWAGAVTTTTDNGGNFARSLSAPPSQGTFLLEIEVTDYTLTSTYEIVLTSLPPPAPAPDLAIALTLDPTAPCVGDMVDLTWSVTNYGTAASPATTAVLQETGFGDLASEAIAPLAPGETVLLADVAVLASAAGSRSFTARVDPNGDVDELTETNNVRGQSFNAFPVCFEWDPDYIHLSTPTVCIDEPLGIGFAVRNTGCLTAPATTVRFFVDGVPQGEQAFAELAGKNQVRSAGFTHTFTMPGTYVLSVAIDPDDLAIECDDGNNTISRTVSVSACPDFVNYRLDACSLAASNAAPVGAEPITFSVRVENTGAADGAAPVAVRFLLDGVPIGADALTTSPLAAGTSEVVTSTATWPVDFAPHQLVAQVDPDDAVPDETSEFDNQGSCLLPYELYPLALPACPPGNPRMFSSCSPCVDDELTIQARVINTGLFTVSGPVSVTFEDHSSGVLTIGSGSVSNLRGRGNCPPPDVESFSFPHTFTQVGAHPIHVRVDAENAWPEFDETNNELVRTANVQSCIPLPDLYLFSEHINPEDINPDPGESVDWITLTVFNDGSGDAAGVLADVNIDGLPLCTDLFLGAIPAGSSRSIQCLAPWLAPAGPPNLHIVQVAVDPDGFLAESDETNNFATRSIVVGPAPDLSVAATDIRRLSGPESGAGLVTVRVRVANGGLTEADGILELGVRDSSGQFALVEQVPVFLPAAAGAESELFVDVTWLAATPTVYVRARLIDVQPQDFDETNNAAQRYLTPRHSGRTNAAPQGPR